MLMNDDKVALESMVDRSSVSDVLACVYEICHTKGMRILETRRDPLCARPWFREAARISLAALHCQL